MTERIMLGKLKNGSNGQSMSPSFVDEHGSGLSKEGRVAAKYMGTVADREEMRALGKEQVLRVG